MVRALSLEEYRHPLAGFSLPVPPGWERIEDPQDGVALIAAEPPDGDTEFRSNAVVTVESLPFEFDLGEWQDSAETLLPQQLPNYSLIDRERLDYEGRQVIRRLAHYVTAETGSVTMEQWATIAGGTGFTLTASISTLAYDSLADVFAEMALRFRPETEVSP